MDCAILAAGAGSRLRASGIDLKPLARVGDEPMIVRLARIMTADARGASRLGVVVPPGAATVICRAIDGASLPDCVSVTVTEASTSGPAGSLACLADALGEIVAPIAVTTADTVFAPEAWSRLMREAAPLDAEAMVTGVTGHIDDEKPLYVYLDQVCEGSPRRVAAFRDTPPQGVARPYVSAGVYVLPPQAFDVLRRCIAAGRTRMRHFQRALLEAGIPVYAVDMGRVVDVDRPSDLAAARLLASETSETT